MVAAMKIMTIRTGIPVHQGPRSRTTIQRADEQNLNDAAQQDEGDFAANIRSAAGSELGDEDGEHSHGGSLTKAERHLRVEQEIKHATAPVKCQRQWRGRLRA